MIEHVVEVVGKNLGRTDCQHVDIAEDTAAGTAAGNNYCSRGMGSCSHCTPALKVGTAGVPDCTAASFPYLVAYSVALPADDDCSSYRLGERCAVPI